MRSSPRVARASAAAHRRVPSPCRRRRLRRPPWPRARRRCVTRPFGPVAAHRRQIDAEVARELARRRRREHLAARRAAHRDHVRRRALALAGSRRRRACRGTAARRFAVRGSSSCFGGSSRAVAAPPRLVDHAPAPRRPRTICPSARADLRDRARARRRDLDRGLVGHDLDHRLVLCDGVARLDQPADDLALDDAFADVGQLELERHATSLRTARSARSPARRDRATAGTRARACTGTACRSRSTRTSGASSDISAFSAIERRQLGAEAAGLAAPRARSRTRPVFFTDVEDRRRCRAAERAQVDDLGSKPCASAPLAPPRARSYTIAP